ncbi:hypothetical protein TorRG33x02_287860 [Trema orientale]|uniref:Uncharacterized protein n=1 Tax=Trema orientale TaxID=63057 RepID=A0A2P5CEV0_TREOI|nr:hypothetical protein TorRG33x02_287860 [Trema orientale]
MCAGAHPIGCSQKDGGSPCLCHRDPPMAMGNGQSDQLIHSLHKAEESGAQAVVSGVSVNYILRASNYAAHGILLVV